MNSQLKRQRELRGWSQAHAAEELARLCEDDPRNVQPAGVNAKMIGSWERGDHLPSLYYRRKLSLLYEKSAEALGFVDPLPSQMAESSTPRLQLLTGVPSNIPQHSVLRKPLTCFVHTQMMPHQTSNWVHGWH
jgi:transcriptional regulator with XRE-family HTH domain